MVRLGKRSESFSEQRQRFAHLNLESATDTWVGGDKARHAAQLARAILAGLIEDPNKPRPIPKKKHVEPVETKKVFGFGGSVYIPVRPSTSHATSNNSNQGAMFGRVIARTSSEPPVRAGPFREAPQSTRSSTLNHTTSNQLLDAARPVTAPTGMSSPRMAEKSYPQRHRGRADSTPSMKKSTPEHDKTRTQPQSRPGSRQEGRGAGGGGERSSSIFERLSQPKQLPPPPAVGSTAGTGTAGGGSGGKPPTAPSHRSATSASSQLVSNLTAPAPLSSALGLARSSAGEALRPGTAPTPQSPTSASLTSTTTTTSPAARRDSSPARSNAPSPNPRRASATAATSSSSASSSSFSLRLRHSSVPTTTTTTSASVSSPRLRHSSLCSSATEASTMRSPNKASPAKSEPQQQQQQPAARAGTASTPSSASKDKSSPSSKSAKSSNQSPRTPDTPQGSSGTCVLKFDFSALPSTLDLDSASVTTSSPSVFGVEGLSSSRGDSCHSPSPPSPIDSPLPSPSHATRSPSEGIPGLRSELAGWLGLSLSEFPKVSFQVSNEPILHPDTVMNSMAPGTNSNNPPDSASLRTTGESSRSGSGKESKYSRPLGATRPTRGAKLSPSQVELLMGGANFRPESSRSRFHEESGCESERQWAESLLASNSQFNSKLESAASESTLVGCTFGFSRSDAEDANGHDQEERCTTRGDANGHHDGETTLERTHSFEGEETYFGRFETGVMERASTVSRSRGGGGGEVSGETEHEQTSGRSSTEPTAKLYHANQFRSSRRLQESRSAGPARSEDASSGLDSCGVGGSGGNAGGGGSGKGLMSARQECKSRISEPGKTSSGASSKLSSQPSNSRKNLKESSASSKETKTHRKSSKHHEPVIPNEEPSFLIREALKKEQTENISPRRSTHASPRKSSNPNLKVMVTSNVDLGNSPIKSPIPDKDPEEVVEEELHPNLHPTRRPFTPTGMYTSVTTFTSFVQPTSPTYEGTGDWERFKRRPVRTQSISTKPVKIRIDRSIFQMPMERETQGSGNIVMNLNLKGKGITATRKGSTTAQKDAVDVRQMVERELSKDSPKRQAVLQKGGTVKEMKVMEKMLSLSPKATNKERARAESGQFQKSYVEKSLKKATSVSSYYDQYYKKKSA